MIEVIITDEMMSNARRKAAEMGEIKNSILFGNGNLTGFVGEEVARHVINNAGFHAVERNTYDYDIVVNGFTTVDVKTKSTSVEPKPHYSCSIASLNTKQLCDYYAFVRVKKDFTKAWWCGVYSKADYMKDAVFMKKGDLDTDNQYVVRSDCYNLPISALKEMI